MNMLALLYILKGRYDYLLSLEGCSGSEHDCLFNIGYILRDIDNCVNSTIYFLFVLTLEIKYFGILVKKIFLRKIFEKLD